MMSWISDKVFTNVDDFILWLDKNFGDYIAKHISENHVHHTWKPDHSSYAKYTTLQLHKNMKNYHVNTNGWDDIAQNITIGKDGDIVTGRDLRKIPISAKGYNGSENWHPFAYEMIGNFDKGNDKLEGKQLETAIKISRYFHKKGKPIKFHRELLLNGKPPKTCPGTGIDKTWFMNYVNDSKFDIKPTSTNPTPIKQKEEDDMLEKAIVINAFSDFPFAEPLAAKLKAPIYTRNALPKGNVAKELYVVGGTKDGLIADKIVVLSGKDRFDVAKAVGDFLKK